MEFAHNGGIIRVSSSLCLFFFNEHPPPAMVDSLTQLHQQLTIWAEDARTGGWLKPQSLQSLENTRLATPSELFDQVDRPLVAGFFGGTGVGKSTLLNRLACEPIAKVSAIRPTSREITAYLHHSRSVDHLPTDFPLHQLKIATHGNDAFQSVMWIDMPDVDSVEASHKHMVSQWLPHIDVLVYVVSPERYRDEIGWRMLLEHGHEHAWLFVINHWDKGAPQQATDFRQLLGSAGLPNPMIFCTDSRAADDADDDDFARLQSTVESLANDQLVRQLEERGVIQRLQQLKTAANKLRIETGDEAQFAALASDWQRFWQTAAEQLMESSNWKTALVAEQFSEKNDSWVWRLLNRADSKAGIGAESRNTDKQLEESDIAHQLIDVAFTDRVKAAHENWLQQLPARGIPLAAMQQYIGVDSDRWKDESAVLLDEALHKSLAMPGSVLQRLLCNIMRVLTVVLPLTALGWIGFRVVNGFRLGGSDPDAYLGTDFAVHGILLLALAWALPAFLGFRLKPSRVHAADRGLTQGIREVLEFIEHKTGVDIERAVADNTDLHHRFDALWTSSATFDDRKLPDHIQRMLLDSEPDQESRGVLAMAHKDTSSAPVS